jgi:hypothetical protein
MGRADWNENVAPVLIEAVPLCHWGFTKSRRFLYISGNTDIFGHSPEELLHQHVSVIDDASRTWAARLDRIFSGAATSDAARSAVELDRAIIHVPIHARGGSVAYAAGFSFPAGSPPPRVRELELAAIAILQVLRAERARNERFLHDVVAQCLSSPAAARGAEVGTGGAASADTVTERRDPAGAGRGVETRQDLQLRRRP